MMSYIINLSSQSDESKLQAGHGVTPETSALKRQRKVGVCKFGASLVYVVHFRPTWAMYLLSPISNK